MKTGGTISLAKIASVVNGEISGDADFRVVELNDLQQAGQDSLSFYVGGKAHLPYLQNTKAGAVILKPEDADQINCHKIFVNDPYLAYAQISQFFLAPKTIEKPIHDKVVMHASAQIGDNVIIGANSVIGADCIIGDNVVIGANVSLEENIIIGADTHIDANVSIYAKSRIGQRCRISSGAVIGSSGFGYAPHQGQWVRIEQLGGVSIGDDVDIGANTTIDCGALDRTTIANGVKIDNHVQIAHNVHIGEHSIMAAFVGIAGSAKIGKRCQLGGRSSIMGHITMVDDVIVHTNTFISKSIDKPGVYSGMLPAQPVKQWLKTLAQLNKLAK